MSSVLEAVINFPNACLIATPNFSTRIDEELVNRIAETDGNDVAIDNIISRQRTVNKKPHPVVNFDTLITVLHFYMNFRVKFHDFWIKDNKQDLLDNISVFLIIPILKQLIEISETK